MKVGYVFVATSVFSCALVAGSMMGGCQGETTSSSGSGASSAASSTSSATASSATGATCTGAVSTVDAIARGDVGPGVPVEVQGVVAMSPKFIVSHSSSGSCLWGVYVSMPGITTTAPYSGILAVSYGNPAPTNEAGTGFCPVLGVDPAGGGIPDETQPGDVLDVIGVTDYFVLPQCATDDSGTGSQVAQRQIANVCKMTKTGTAAIPTAAVLSGGDVAKLGDFNSSDRTFHDQWGGVKVEVQNVTTVDQGGSVTDTHGVIHLAGSGLNVVDSLYYQGLLASEGHTCHSGPILSSPTTFSSLVGFSSLNFCTWGLAPLGKCPPDMEVAGTSPPQGSFDCPCSL